jgi:1-aminocyclopropane-1-carboxylate deaminase
MLEFEKIINLPTPLTEIFNDLFTSKKVRVFIKRDDLTHSTISGNKFRKLKYNLEQAKKEGKKKLVTFGGAYSNHVAAVAEAGNCFDFETLAIIRGEELHEQSSETLKKAAEKGMQFRFVSRTSFRSKETLVEAYQYSHYIIPEGGSNDHCLRGVAEMTDEVLGQLPAISHICVAVGTGGTMAGILHNTKFKGKVLGLPVLKNASFLKTEIEQLLNAPMASAAYLCGDYHFGGYAKWDTTLVDFILNFEKKYTIKLDQVYTGKLLFGVFDLIAKNYFPENAQICVIHTGGLQGRLPILNNCI